MENVNGEKFVVSFLTQHVIYIIYDYMCVYGQGVINYILKTQHTFV